MPVCRACRELVGWRLKAKWFALGLAFAIAAYVVEGLV